MVETGTLWDEICTVTSRAMRSGDLQPIATRCEYIEDAGVRFLVRIAQNVARKRNAQTAAQRAAERRNPFLPYDPKLYVGDVTETHVCLLNKFNVVDHHLLIVTRRFEHQDQALTLDDFQALSRCMAEYEGLGFYNGGTLAGASQPHKHLQVVPLPIQAEGPRLPMDPLLAIRDSGSGRGQTAMLPFPHAVARLDPLAVSRPDNTAELMLSTYRDLLQNVGIANRAGRAAPVHKPYNLLVTRQWMLLVPRTRESFESISLNALAFAGSLFVQNQQEMDLLRAIGPMHVLCYVTS
jgi:ATP adenylyltransferase